MSIYHKVVKVPAWVLIDLKGSKLTKVKAFLAAAEAYEQKWPSQGYYDHLQKYRNIGWAHALKPGLPVDTQLIARSAAEYAKEFFTPRSQIAVPHSAQNWNRVMDTPEQAALFFDALMFAQEPIELCQLFAINERCFSLGKNYKLFYTAAPANKNVLTRLTDNAITIGETDSDLNLADVKAKDLDQELVDFFTAVLGKIK